MDPTNFYHLGQIEHQERVKEAEERHLAQAQYREPTRLQRLIARFRANTSAAGNEWAYRNIVAADQ